MRLLMLETRRGTEDGFTIRQYFAGQEYDIAEGLARAFLAAGVATQYILPKSASTPTERLKTSRRSKRGSSPIIVHKTPKKVAPSIDPPPGKA